MGLSRRFLNLIVRSDEPASRSLRRIDLERLQLFFSPPAPAIRRPIKMEDILLPDPSLKFQAHSYRGDASDGCRLACYPFGQRKVLSTDQARRNILYDVETRDVALMPCFHKPKLHGCLSLFVPVGDGEDDNVEEEEEGEDGYGHEEERQGRGAGSLYLMPRRLKEVKRFKMAAGQPSMDFEVLFYGNGRATSHCRLLPLPPFAVEPISPNERPEIRSYTVVGGGSHICVSVDGRGTYTLDTASHTWDKVADWTLPFHGKVEYVPELKLWFGLSGDAQHLAAADLSSMDAHSPPQLAAGHGWEEFQPPEVWAEWAGQGLEINQEDVQLVNLGSGRFCIARFFIDWRTKDDGAFHFVILTGVEVVERVFDNQVKLEMIPHKSISHHKSLFDRTNIEQLF